VQIKLNALMRSTAGATLDLDKLTGIGGLVRIISRFNNQRLGPSGSWLLWRATSRQTIWSKVFPLLEDWPIQFVQWAGQNNLSQRKASEINIHSDWLKSGTSRLTLNNSHPKYQREVVRMPTRRNGTLDYRIRRAALLTKIANKQAHARSS
jgi:hypothetical protein